VIEEIRFRPKPGIPFSLDPLQLANWFLDIHGWWFTTRSNDLYGWRGSCREALVEYLEDGTVPTNPRTGYVVDKFREVEGWFEREERGGD
jgi:hypothetical protein